MTTAERWRPVLGYEGLYAVSDQGRVKSVRRVCRVFSKSRGKFYDQQLQNRILKPQPTGASPTVALYRDAKRFQVCVAKVVREAFPDSPAGSGSRPEATPVPVPSKPATVIAGALSRLPETHRE